MNLDNSPSLEVYTTKKLNTLNKKYDILIHADVFFKKENDSKGHGKIREIELRLSVPRVFASANEKNYELAVKHVISDLDKQLKKEKAF